MNHTHSQNGSSRASSGHILITGGCGFVGTNLADALLRAGHNVLLFDDLSRRGVMRNLDYLRREHGPRAGFMHADVRDLEAVRCAVDDASDVFHFAAQVAVTTSLQSPFDDFEINARGTLNVLEAVRETNRPIPILFTSTNKVYGGLENVALRCQETRYEPENDAIRTRGISEARPLEFHSPYGCSKGAADQYVLDYARTFGLQACAFRMSCIYGPHQQGNEDQGWVAHFALRALQGEPITLFGDGRQVRDLLWAEDLVSAFTLARENIAQLSGRAFNIGGGSGQAASLLEVVRHLERLNGRRVPVQHEEWRTGDQRYYVSDTRAFQDATGWRPQVGVDEGVARLHAWLCDNSAQPLQI